MKNYFSLFVRVSVSEKSMNKGALSKDMLIPLEDK
jgi:hypothetical protein